MSMLRRADRLFAALFGIAYFVHLTDLRVLDPRRSELAAGGDLANHFIAQDFARWDSWHWPATWIGNYFWPVGTNAVFTDANPWLTLFIKLFVPADGPPL